MMVLCLQTSVFAQSTSSTVNDVILDGSSALSIDKETPGNNEAEDITDQILTNNQLRASVGSLSKYSITTSFSYNGGSVEKPFDAFRPNLSGSNQSLTTLESISGSVGLKYRVSPTESLSLSGGLRMLTPFHAEYTAPNPQAQQIFDQQHGNFDLNTPSIGYTYIFRWGSTQNIIGSGISYTTDGNARNIGYVGSIGISHTIAYEIGTSGVTIGASYSVSAYAFDKGTNAVVGIDTSPTVPPNTPLLAGPFQTLYQIDMGPSIEYQINRRLNIHTGIGLTLEHNRGVSALTTFKQDQVWQGLGLGIMIVRDVFLFPNVSFVPTTFAWSRTNVGLATNINIF
jgi:hypothetical protein